ncbi:uncharacterized protein LOC133298223 [Gastrolobium bilobum]|uniref:uncharacterized protein LOC133298223 n=1 Tax=Gastrolobium bilobum TaxID=150636 RepID=UPI002AB07D88|nr:uncharacterized protein LOC133298223 [Gastrolobium bilobum]
MDAIREANRKAIEDVLEANRLACGKPDRLINRRTTVEKQVAGIQKVLVCCRERIAGSTSKDFDTCFQQDSDLEKFRVNHEARKVKRSEVKGNNSSISWRDRKFRGKGKGKQLQVKQLCNKFKRSTTLAGHLTGSLTIPKCTGCGEGHLGPCATGQTFCFQCGQEGHYVRDFPSSTARVVAVQAVPLLMVPLPPTSTPAVPPAPGRVYSLDHTMEIEELMLVPPPWLEPLLSTTFFSLCKVHNNAPRNECNMFCLDCGDQAFCFYCRQSWHKDHHVIQIRRSSYHDVVRVAEIQKVLDISGVQTYVINSARVLFLNERPQNQPRTNNAVSSGKSNTHLCEICRRNLLDPFRFCSLGCKVVGIKKNGNASFVLSAKKDEEIGRMEEGMARRLPSKEEDEKLREGIHKQVYQSTPCPCLGQSQAQACSNSRRRKGIPRRAPL